MPEVRIYDNGGETFDRYTVIIDRDIYGMSDSAMAPNGFNQYCGTIGECGYSDHYENDAGERSVKLFGLPEQVRVAIALRVNQYY